MASANAAKLADEGWERRSSYDEPRLSELVEMYQELGYEVRLEALDLEEEPGCSACLKANPEQFKTVYTRKKP